MGCLRPGLFRSFWGGGGHEFGKTFLYNTCTLPNNKNADDPKTEDDSKIKDDKKKMVMTPNMTIKIWKMVWFLGNKLRHFFHYSSGKSLFGKQVSFQHD